MKPDYRYSRIVTRKTIDQFGEISGDYNPIHFDEAYAATTIFKGCIAHGCIAEAYLSAAIAQAYPKCILLRKEVNYTAPVRANDQVDIVLTEWSRSHEQGFVKANFEATVKDKPVLKGNIVIRLPK